MQEVNKRQSCNSNITGDHLMGSVVVNRSDCEFMKKIPENLVRIVLALQQNDSALGTRIIKWNT